MKTRTKMTALSLAAIALAGCSTVNDPYSPSTAATTSSVETPFVAPGNARSTAPQELKTLQVSPVDPYADTTTLDPFVPSGNARAAAPNAAYTAQQPIATVGPQPQTRILEPFVPSGS